MSPEPVSTKCLEGYNLGVKDGRLNANNKWKKKLKMLKYELMIVYQDAMLDTLTEEEEGFNQGIDLCTELIDNYFKEELLAGDKE